MADYELAESAYLKVLEMAPGEADVYGSLATVYKNKNQLEKAETHYRQAMQLDANDPRHQYQLSLCLQARGKFSEAWPLYEAGFNCGERYPDYSLSTPRWDGKPLKEDEPLLIWGEQGVGDELYMASMLSDISRLAPNVILECDERIVDLLARSFPDIKTMPKATTKTQDISYQIPLGGLFEYVRDDLTDFPQHNGFLKADSSKQSFWEKRLSEVGCGLKVGISWTSGLKTLRRQSALSELADWVSILNIADIEFVNLQYGDVSDEINQVEEQTGVKIHRWNDIDMTQDLEDVAGLISNLDLVITVGTSVHNLAAGLGTDCWTILRMPQGVVEGINYIPAYPNMRVFAKTYQQKWPDILQDVSSALKTKIEK